MHGTESELVRLECLGQRHEVEDHSERNRGQRDPRQEVAAPRKEQQGVDEPDAVTSDRDSQPQKGHGASKSLQLC